MVMIIKIDKQGRLVLPKEVRAALGVRGEAKLVCKVVGSKVVLESFSLDEIERAFRRLSELVPSLDADTVEVEGEDKYIDEEYALRKIGLRGSR